MILTDKQIEEAIVADEIGIEPFEKNQIEPATYDFRVGMQGATTSKKKVINLKEHGYITLEPGDFAVVTTLEKIRLGAQYAARFGLRSKYARKGLMATTGPQIDPGFHGRLIIGITNLTPKPITLPYGDDFVSVEFHKLSEPCQKPYCGPYQEKNELGPEEIEAVTESEGMALSEVLTTLRSLSQNVGVLTKDVTSLESSVTSLRTTLDSSVNSLKVSLDSSVTSLAKETKMLFWFIGAAIALAALFIAVK